MLFLVLDPSDFDKIFLTPASSTTALTAPPALTPVPSQAGFNKILLAPCTPVASCGIVPSTIETFVTFLVAAATAFLIASGTSFDYILLCYQYLCFLNLLFCFLKN